MFSNTSKQIKVYIKHHFLFAIFQILTNHLNYFSFLKLVSIQKLINCLYVYYYKMETSVLVPFIIYQKKVMFIYV